VAATTLLGAGTAVVLRTSDGVESTIDCPPDTTILDAAAAAGLFLPSMCGQGSCGACAATVTEGDYAFGDHDPSVVDHPDRGGVLLCRTTPQGVCRVTLPYDRSRVVNAPPAIRTAQVSAVEPVADAVVRLELTLAPDEHGGTAAEFDPGQFVQLQLPGREPLRAYSLANGANWDGLLELYVRLHPGGFFSTYLLDRARVGDTIIVHGPRGGFGLHENGFRPRWFVAGGTGLAPMLSMLRRMAEWGEAAPARLYFGVNTTGQVFGTAPIEALAEALPDFRASVCVWRPDGEDPWPGFVGTAVEALSADLADIDEPPDIYVCGPPAMVEAVQAAARAAGIPDEQVNAERFTAS
jgi:ferredoxin-NADP reductase/ferredoxin